MDGIFVAYHNAHEMFGFQYICREEMDERLYGNSMTGDAAFNLILQVYNKLLAAIVPLYPRDHTIRLTFAPDRVGSKLTLFAEDVGRDEAKQGSDIKQFIVTMSSLVNGFRTEHVTLDPRGNDEWMVNMVLSKVATNTVEYDAVKAKVTAVRSDLEDGREENFMRLIKENTSFASLSHHGPDIIAPWTII